ncbi:MAG: NAD-dependent epimerase/dehydratase family protein [Gemmatirosa sp.]
MLALVTGASGFVGSHLVDALLAEGWRVRRLARPASPPATDARLATRVAPLDDAAAIVRSGALADVDAIFHVAGVTRAHSAARFRAGNVAPTAALLDAAADAAPHARGVLVSSQAAGGPADARDRPRTEDDAPAPVGAYGASKREAERLVAAHAIGARWTVVRPSAVYGPRDRDFVPVFRHAARGVALYPGTRDAWLSIVHAHDLARALVLAACTPAAAGRTYFVAGDEAVSWPDVYAAAARAAGARVRWAHDAPRWALAAVGALGDAWSAVTGHDTLAGREKLALAAPRWWLCSAARARTELAWRPEIPLDDGMRATRAWYREAGWL